MAKYEIKKLRNLASLQPPPFLFRGYLRDQSITQITADSFTGKSMLMLAMANCLDYGKPLFGQFEPTKLRKVLYIGLDSPEWDYGQQTLKIQRGLGINPELRARCEIDAITDQSLQVTEPDFLKWFDETQAEHNYNVVIFDTFANIHPFNENDNQLMARVMRNLKYMRDKHGIAIIFAHHTPKPSEFKRSAIHQGRGAGSIAASCDFQIYITRRKNRIFIDYGKARGAVAENHVEFYDMVDVEVEENGEFFWGIQLVTPTITRDNHIKLLFIEKGTLTRREIADHLKLDPTYAKEKMEDKQFLRLADNGIQSLRLTHCIKSVERGKWQWIKKG